MRGVGALLLINLVVAGPAAAAETLVYRGVVGQIAEYQVTMKATGEQMSLRERRPVNLEAEFVVREEVVACDPGGTFFLQVTGSAVKVKDRTKAFGGRRLNLPSVVLHLSPQGETLGAEAVAPEGIGLREGATAELLPQLLPVILPSGPVEAGQTWLWQSRGAKQTNRLVKVSDGVAHLASEATAPLSLTESSGALGLTAAVTGKQTQLSTVELDLESGLVRRHKGNLVLQAKTEVEMDTPEGVRRFPSELELRVTFESRLVGWDGQPASEKGSAR